MEYSPIMLSDQFRRTVEWLRDSFAGGSITDAVSLFDAQVKAAAAARKERNQRGILFEKMWEEVKAELEPECIEEIRGLGHETQRGNASLETTVGNSYVRQREKWSAEIIDEQEAIRHLLTEAPHLIEEHLEYTPKLNAAGRSAAREYAVAMMQDRGEVVPWAKLKSPGPTVVHRSTRDATRLRVDNRFTKAVQRVQGEIAEQEITDE
jgi:hypothetical protein